MNLSGLHGRGLSTSASEKNHELLERSAAARLGHRAIRLAVIVRTIEPVLALAAAVLLVGIGMTRPAFAQGSIFGQDNQAVGSGVREAIRWGRNLLFLLGVGGIGWGAINYMTEKQWGRQMVGGGLCMGIGGILSLVYSFSQGNAVNLDTDLGN